MRQFARKQTIWGMGLSETAVEEMRALTGPAYVLQVWEEGTQPDFSDSATLQAPCLICFGLDACRDFARLPYEQTAFLDLTPKAVFLDQNAPQEALEAAIDLGVGDIIRMPLSKARFGATLRKAAEAAALQRDIQNMAREVFIERELLERKNETLSFLVNFLTNTSDCFDESELLLKAYACLQHLFPVVTMNAALLTRGDNDAMTADFYIAAPPKTDAHDAWRDRLFETAQSMNAFSPVTPTTMHLPLPGADAAFASPADGHILTLPVHMGSELQFFLMLLTPMERNLSRDQAQALDSALRHMALSLKNARRYQEMCTFADRDGLTGTYNRRFFEQALAGELARHVRYKEDLSLLLLDIDFFKKVNDTWGHIKGDEVLRGVAATILNTIRQTDCCVRYGGEEFVIILPHTTAQNAEWLAERLRKKVSKLSFSSCGKEFNVTASIGVSSVAAGERKDGPTFIHEADTALYRAKASGRNRVLSYSSGENLAASM
ncbi:MAG: hypothetical protein DELT_01597 [Desulfovibrio sp.]